MIDFTKDRVLKLADAAKLLPKPRRGRPVHAGTLHRWARHGMRGVHLEVIQMGGVLCTSEQALQRFFERLTDTLPKPNKPAVAEEPHRKDSLDETLAARGF